MRTRTVRATVALGVLTFVTWWILRGDPYDALVEEVINVPQTYDGEHVDKLVALGPDAVPAIGAALTSGEEFPLGFVLALERIGDRRGMHSIMAFVAEQTPYSDVDKSTLTARSILALTSQANVAACAPTSSILQDVTAHPRVRLAAASVSAALFSEGLRAYAQEHILEAYRERMRYLADPNTGFTQGELYSALIAVDNDESLSILLDLLNHDVPERIALPVIGYLAEKGGERAMTGLLNVIEDPERHSLPIRLAAGSGVLELRRVPTAADRDMADAFLGEARSGGWPEEIVQQAQRLSERARW